jgi:tetratricopeptide (TPR) repeat protein
MPENPAAARTPAATPPRPNPALESQGMGRSAVAPDAGARASASLSLDAANAARRSAQTSASMANIDAQHQRARAATVMQASSRSVPALLANLRANPVMLFGAVAVLFGIGFGIYVYLQVAQPGLFTRQAAKQPDTFAPPPLPSAPSTPSQEANPLPTDVAGAQPLPGAPANPAVAVPASASTAGTLPAAATAAGTPTAAAAPAFAAAVPERGAVAGAGGGPVSAASVIGGPRPAEPPRDGAPSAARAGELPREGPLARAADLAPERGSIAPRPEARRPPPAPEPVRAAAAPAEIAAARERIAITPAAGQPKLNPSLSLAYTTLQSGDLQQARSLYSRVLQSEPLNVDALLGLAYVAAQENRSDDAVRFYVRILQVNPRHAAAQAALIGLMGRANAVESESRLKTLIAREPSAFLHFVLGNLYADQSLWAQAQQAYFQAHHLEPENPDYAYNLAVGLDHVTQRKLALNFYRRAEQLAASQGRSNFSLAHARERISSLSSQLE